MGNLALPDLTQAEHNTKNRFGVDFNKLHYICIKKKLKSIGTPKNELLFWRQLLHYIAKIGDTLF